MVEIDPGVVAQYGLEEARRDPLRSQRWSSPEARRLAELLNEGHEEVVVRAGNAAGKTVAGATLAVSAAVGRTSIDGRTINEAARGDPYWEIPLPHYPIPNVGIVVVSSYKQAAESTLSAVLRLVGERDHHVVSTGALQTQAIYVRGLTQGDEPDWRQWSRMFFFPVDGSPPEGFRAHWAWGDETPPLPIWDEVRRRRMARLPYRRWITHTPIDIAKWEWLRAELEQSGAPEVVLRVLDNEALSESDRQAIVEGLAFSPLRDARLNGGYVNLAGSNPWKEFLDFFPTLEGRCVKPRKVEQVEVWSELQDQTQAALATVDVEIWETPRDDHVYYAFGDPSLGIDDPDHDPLGMHVHDMTEPALVARYNGFVGGYGLGALLAWTAEWYNDAVVWPDVTGGYAGPVLTALKQYRSERHPAGYHILGRDRRSSKDDPEAKVGFSMTADNKAEALEAIRVWLRRQQQGVESFICPSRAVIQCLTRAVVDKHNRLVKPGSVRYEDAVLLGYGLRLLQQYGRQFAPVRPPEDGILKKILQQRHTGAILPPSWASRPRVRSLRGG